LEYKGIDVLLSSDFTEMLGVTTSW